MFITTSIINILTLSFQTKSPYKLNLLLVSFGHDLDMRDHKYLSHTASYVLFNF
jgi:hypothetical protein